MPAGKNYLFGFKIAGDPTSGVKAVKKTTTELKDLEKQSKKNAKALRESKVQAKGFNTTLSSMSSLLAPIVASVGLFTLASKFKEVAVSTATYNAQLVTMTGSQEKASQAFAKLNDFAKTTPFTLDQSIQGFTKLTALGLTPSERAMTSYGNTAVAMGKSLNQMIEAVADASTLEFERLKEFGIKSRQQGDNVTFTFQGIETTVKKDAAAIEGYLTSLGENNFGDAMSNQMEALPGKLSNLEDSVDRLFRKFGEQGGNAAFGGMIDMAADAVVSITESIGQMRGIAISAIPHIQELVFTVQSNMLDIVGTVETAKANIVFVWDILVAAMRTSFETMLVGLLQTVGEWVNSLADMVDKAPFDFAKDAAADLRSMGTELVNTQRSQETFTEAYKQLEKERADSIKNTAEIITAKQKVLEDAKNEEMLITKQVVASMLAEELAIQATDTALEDLAKTSKKVGAETTKITTSQQKLIDKLFPLEAAVRKYKEELVQIDALYEVGSTKHIEAVKALKLQYAELFPEVARMEELAKASEVAWTRGIERIDDSLFGLFRSGLEGWDKFKDGVVSTVKDMIAQILFNYAKVQFFNLTAGVSMSGAGGVAAGALGAAGTAGAGFLGAGAAGAAGGAGAGFLSGAASNVGSAFGVNAWQPGTLDAGGNLMVTGGMSLDLMQFGKGVGLSILGGFAGTKVGEALTGKTANSNIGATVGAVVGSAIPVIGTFLGAAIGGLLDGIFGSKSRDPELEFSTAQDFGGLEGRSISSEQSYLQSDDFRFARKSELGAFSVGTKHDGGAGLNQGDIDALSGFFDSLKEIENQIASLVDPSQVEGIKKALAAQKSAETENLDFYEHLAERYKILFDEIGGDVDATFDRLTASMSDEDLIKSLDLVAGAAFQIADMKESLSEGSKHLDAIIESEKTLFELYVDQVDVLNDVGRAYDGSVDSINNLTNALSIQQGMAGQLALSYEVLSRNVDTSLNSAIDKIRESVLSDEELYNERQQAIGALFGELQGSIDPSEIASLVSQITAMSTTAFQSLNPEQQGSAAGGFQGFLEQVKSTAQNSIEQGMALLVQQEQASIENTLKLIESQDAFTDAINLFTEFDWETILSRFGIDLTGAAGEFSGSVTDLETGLVTNFNNIGQFLEAVNRDLDDFNPVVTVEGGEIDTFDIDRSLAALDSKLATWGFNNLTLNNQISALSGTIGRTGPLGIAIDNLDRALKGFEGGTIDATHLNNAINHFNHVLNTSGNVLPQDDIDINLNATQFNAGVNQLWGSNLNTFTGAVDNFANASPTITVQSEVRVTQQAQDSVGNVWDLGSVDLEALRHNISLGINPWTGLI